MNLSTVGKVIVAAAAAALVVNTQLSIIPRQLASDGPLKGVPGWVGFVTAAGVLVLLVGRR